MPPKKKNSGLQTLTESRLNILLLFTLIFLVLIGVLRITAKRLGHEEMPPESRRKEELSQANIKGVYEKKSAAIMRYFTPRVNSGSTTERLSLVVKTREDLLDLTVPVEYKDLHLNLVIALTKLENGYQGDAARLASGQKDLREIYDSYQWLR